MTDAEKERKRVGVRGGREVLPLKAVVLLVELLLLLLRLLLLLLLLERSILIYRHEISNVSLTDSSSQNETYDTAKRESK